MAEQESEREKMLLELKQFKTDAAIADLELQDLQNQPRPNDLEIAKMEFRQAQSIQSTENIASGSVQ